jgi:hypothetical protein
MKDLKEYITEKKWSLSIHQRNAFSYVLGVMLGETGEKEEIELFANFKNELTKTELKRYKSIYDVFTDDFAYRSVNNKIFKDDFDLLSKFSKWIEENDIADKIIKGHRDWDLVNAYEKILYT